MKIFLPFILLSVIFMLAAGCGPTYPWVMVDEAVVQMCKEEYSIDVKVKLAGSTVGVYLPIDNLLNQMFTISKEASEKINDVILSVSRVTLSSNAPIKFYLVIAQDPKFPEVEIIIIRYVDDIKRFHFSQISRGDFFDRALIELKLTPQAQKEKILKAIFQQLEVQEADEFLDEFMAMDVSSIGDIGYWNNQFFIKEISLEEFLALQIAKRAKRKFGEDAELKDRFKVNSIKGKFLAQPERSFEFDLDISLPDKETLFIDDEERGVMFEAVIDVAGSVLHGYKFEDFETVSLEDSITGERLFVTKLDIENFKKGKLKIRDLRWKR